LGYDVAIAGGGLAGLALSVQLAKKGHRVIVFEKEQYPFHKVCGEYISMESWDFLMSLGLDLEKLNPSSITKLEVSAPNGKVVKQKLPFGGFGISRYLLDYALVEIARLHGVMIEENTKVNEIAFDGSVFSIDTSKGNYTANLVCGCYGKRSKLDIKWKRPFAIAKKNKLNNYIGIKYHIKTDFPVDTIALHNFSGGYCGIVKVEGNKYNLCYLTTAANIQRCKGNIREMEQSILYQNPHLKKMFCECEMLYKEPLTISQISFDKKTQVVNHILMIGDAAGMITPLCGNGMSMALHASKLAAEQIHLFLRGHLSRTAMEKQYSHLWKKQFSKRLQTGRRIQRLFGSQWVTNVFISIVKLFPGLINYLVRQTHGKPF
jgi:flavin-dependent dehydrogenase